MNLKIHNTYFHFFSRTPPEEEFVLPTLPQIDPRLLSNAPPELLRSHSFQPAGQSVFYPPVLGPPKYAWSPRLPSRSQLPESRMFSESNRMYQIHPYFGSRDVQQYPLSDYLPPYHGRDVSGGHDLIGGPPSNQLGTSHSSPQLAHVRNICF